MIEVEVDGIGVIEFPDSMSKDEIQQVLSKKFSTQPKGVIPTGQPELLGTLGIPSLPSEQDVSGNATIQPIPPSPMSPGEAVKSAAGSYVQGLATLPSSILESMGAVDEEMRRKGIVTYPGPAIQTPKGQQNPLLQAGQEIREAVAKVAPTDPRAEGSFWLEDVPSGVGQAAGFLAGGLAGKALKLPALLVPGAMGAAAGGAEGYRDALASDADDETAFNSFLLNAGIGASEAIPIERILSRINRASGGRLRKAITDAVTSGLEEGVQETAQQAASNIIAQNLYDEERKTLEGVGRGGAAGFVVGALLGGGGSGIQQFSNRRAESETGKDDPQIDSPKATEVQLAQKEIIPPELHNDNYNLPKSERSKARTEYIAKTSGLKREWNKPEGADVWIESAEWNPSGAQGQGEWLVTLKKSNGETKVYKKAWSGVLSNPDYAAAKVLATEAGLMMKGKPGVKRGSLWKMLEELAKITDEQIAQYELKSSGFKAPKRGDPAQAVLSATRRSTLQIEQETEPLVESKPATSEDKLALIVNQATEIQSSPSKVGISPAGTSKPTDVVLGAEDLQSLSPQVEKRWQAAIKNRPGFIDRIAESAVSLWHSVTREYSDLNPRTFAREIDILRRLRASKGANARITVDVLRGVTHNLGPKQYAVFNRVVALEDLVKDAESGKYEGREMPFGYQTTEELQADLEKFQKIANATPQIRTALGRRLEFMDSLRNTLVDRGFLPETVLDDPRYFHHQVLFYLNAKHSQTRGSPRSFRDWFSGWQKKRKGSELDYNREYIEAEAEVIADAFNKIDRQNMEAEMDKSANIVSDLKQIHGEEWRNNIPRTHRLWQPKKGNVFFPGHTVVERAMEEYFEGIRELLPEDFREALLVGPRRREWVIPKELAGVLDDLGPRKDNWIDKLAGAGISAWKRWILLNPLRALKYNINNASGDLDFVFAVHPGIFTEFKDAATLMHGFHVQKKAARGQVKDALKFGVIGSGWRASELPNIGSSEFFSWLTGQNPRLLDRYWKWIGKWNDFREDIGRFASYRFALKQWESGKRFYGASVPSDVDKLPTTKEKAAKVAREILIDYGRETEFGEFMRRKIIPFYRWMHGNAARYIQLVRNVPYSDQLTRGKVAKLVAKQAGKKVAAESAALTARMAMGYFFINMWNHLFFSDEEEELTEADRRQLHLIVGRDDQGHVQTIRFQGALSDLLSWVGLEDLPQDVMEMVKGEASAGDKMKDAYEAAVGKIVNAASPFYKTAAEAMAQRSFYPNPLHPSPVRDKAEHVAALFGLRSVYKWLAGKPHKPLRQELAGLVAYSTDPGEAAYNVTRSMAYEWLEDQGEETGSIIPSKKSNLLYYYRQATKYKDKELADKFLQAYFDAGGTSKGLTASLQRAHPLTALGKRRNEFLDGLSPEEQATVKRAEDWYYKTYR